MNRPTLIQILRSNTFAIYIAIASVIVQSFHSFYAFYKISSLNDTGWGIAQAVLFAIIVDAAVLFYTVRKNTKVTWMAAFVMVLINLYVYWTHLGMTFDFILGVLISFVIPVSNYFYSEEIDDEPALGNAIIWDNDKEKLKVLDGLNKEVIKLSKERDDLRERLLDANANDGLAIEGIKSLKEERDRIWKDREEFIGTIQQLEGDLQTEKSKATKYITELREEIKKRDEVIKAYVPMPNFPKGTNEDKIDEFIDKVNSRVKGFASLKSPAQEEVPPTDKSLLGVDKIVHTDRPNK